MAMALNFVTPTPLQPLISRQSFRKRRRHNNNNEQHHGTPHTPPQTRPRPRPRQAIRNTWAPGTDGSGGGGGKPPGAHPRPQTSETDPSFIPQTIEYAIQQAQAATEAALCAGHTNLRVELPMGRARTHWYVLSPLPAWYAEATVQAFHYAEMFKGVHITIVLGCGPGVTHPVPWIAELRRLEDDTPPPSASLPAASLDDVADGQHSVVIFAGVATAQQTELQNRLREIGTSDAVILFNCFLDAPITHTMPKFEVCYLCRAFDKMALLREGLWKPWAIFVEIAVFEFEWVGDKASTDDWTPTQDTLERFAFSRGAVRAKGPTVYYATPYSGCEAGFWPFMTTSCREVLPLDGRILDHEDNMKKQAKRRKPFGFF